MPDKISSKYEAKHLANIRKYQKQVQSIYHKTIDKIFKKSSTIKPKGATFRVTDYPTFNNYLTEVLQEFRTELEFSIINGIKESWDLSNEKNDSIFTESLAGRQLSDKLNDQVFGRNEKALEAFIARKTKGLGLSERVWKYKNQFQKEIEEVLFTGISEGKPAAVMAREARQYLKQPDKLFRRVRNAEGKLVLSKAAKEYKPGQGVYRSSYKNALRLTRNETNFSYRTADQERWNNTKFVLGYEVRLSNNHKTYDICDLLQGEYPKTFVWKAWHPNCICTCLPILPKPEDYDKYEDAILNGTDDKFQFKGNIKDIPKEAKEWYKDNKERIANWSSKPYFLRDNDKYFNKVF